MMIRLLYVSDGTALQTYFMIRGLTQYFMFMSKPGINSSFSET